MGADLICTFAWYRLGDMETKTVTPAHGDPYTFEFHPPLLDFDNARSVLREVVAGWDEGKIDTYREYEGLECSDDEIREEAIKVGLANLANLESIFKGEDAEGNPVYVRDVETRTFVNGRIGFLVTGGMSHGDSPSDTYDLLNDWYDTDKFPDGERVLHAVGFLPAPYDQIGLIA